MGRGRRSGGGGDQGEVPGKVGSGSWGSGELRRGVRSSVEVGRGRGSEQGVSGRGGGGQRGGQRTWGVSGRWGGGSADVGGGGVSGRWGGSAEGDTSGGRDRSVCQSVCAPRRWSADGRRTGGGAS